MHLFRKLSLLLVTIILSVLFSCDLLNQVEQNTPVFRINYNGNGHTSGLCPYDDKIYNNGDYALIEDCGSMIKSNYSFINWNTQPDGSGVTYNSGTIISINSSDLTLYAQWEEVSQYNITYISNSHNSGTVPINANSYQSGDSIIISDPGVLSREDYSFYGWNTKEDGTGQFYSIGSEIVVGESDITLYAIWTPIETHSVIYYAHDITSGSVPVDNINYVSGDYITILSGVNLIREGYMFHSWNTSSDGNGKTYLVNATEEMENQDLILYAQWYPVYTITYNYDSADSGTITQDTASYLSGTTIQIIDNSTITKSGYRLSGWTIGSQSSDVIYTANDDFVLPDYNVTFYPIWEELNTYTLTYINGDSTVSELSYTELTEVTISSDLEKDGYIFLGWSGSNNGTSITHTNGDKFTITQDIILYSVWEKIPVFKLILNGNNYTDGTLPSSTYDIISGTYIEVPDNSTFSRDDYTFVEWNTESTGLGTSYSSGSNIQITNDVTLYAIWEEIPLYSIIYDGNGHTSGVLPTGLQNVESGWGQSAAYSSNIYKTGYNFLEWNTSSSGDGTTYNPGDMIYLYDSNITIYAIWEKVYTLSFSGNDESNGSAPSSIVVNDTEAEITIPSEGTLERDDFYFLEWNTMSSGNGTSYNAGDTIIIGDNDEVLYAIWEEIPEYTLSFEGNDETDGTAPSSITTKDTTEELTIPELGTLEREYYTFVEWNTESDGSGTSYIEGDTIVLGAINITLYAIWDPLPTYSLLYSGNYNSEGDAPAGSLTNLSGTIITISGANTLEKAYHTFIGWNTDVYGNGTLYLEGDEIEITDSNITLYAHWEQNPTYNITYLENAETEGATPSDTTNYFTGQIIEIENENTLIKSEHAFYQWNTESNGTGTPYYPGDELTVGEDDITLYAIWLPTYTITYLGNGNSDGTAPIDDELYISGSIINLSDNSDLIKDGYRFIGWNEYSNGAGITYEAGYSYENIDADLTLYAIWSREYSITYHNDNDEVGTVPTDNTLYISGESFEVQDYTDMASGNDLFLGWDIYSSASTARYLTGEEIDFTSSSYNLYAVWQKKYTVTYHGDGADSGDTPIDNSLYSYNETCNISSPDSLIKDEYTFYRWYRNPELSGTSYSSESTLTIYDDVDFYPCWRPNLSITYDGNGQTEGDVPVDNQTYIEDDYYTVATDEVLEKLGYYQDGWNTEPDGTGSSYSSGSSLKFDSTDIILYAKWEPKRKVSYYSNNGTVESEPVLIDYYMAREESITIRGGDFVEYDGYTFLGWRKNNNSTYYYEGETYDDYYTDLALYARWRENLTVTYSGNGHTDGDLPEDSTIYLYGIYEDATVLAPGTLEKENYWFVNWLGSDNQYYEVGDIIDMDEDITLTAQWEENHTVTYRDTNSTSGSAPVDSLTYKNSTTVTVIGRGDLSREHYDFLGWGSSSYGSVQYVAGDTFNITSDITLYPIWEEHPQYSIEYIGNGHEYGIPQPVYNDYYAGETIILSTVYSMTKENYDFKGWKLDIDGTSADYLPGAEYVIPSHNITLYGHWEEKPKLIYYGNGNTSTDTEILEYKEWNEEVTIEDIESSNLFSKTNHILKEWNTSPDGDGISYSRNDTITIMEDTFQLYAIWTEATDGLEYTLDTDETFYTITDHDGVNLDIIIPAKYQGLPVSQIEKLSLAKTITSLVIPESVTTLVENMFYNYDDLISVTLPSSITILESGTFQSCNALTTINLDNVVTIKEDTFNYCISLNNINLENVEYIGNNSFRNCSALETVELTNIVELGVKAFFDCSSLSSVTLGSSLITILDETFSGCDDLTSIVIPSSVESIGYRAFYDLSFLNSVTLNEGLQTIGEEAFYQTGVNSITIPGSVSNIGMNAFYKCLSLHTVVILEGSGLIIETNAFRENTNLTTLTINSGLTSIGSYAFYYADISTLNLPDTVEYIESRAFSVCSLETVILSSSLKEIGYRAFFDSNYISTLTIPMSVTTIGDEALDISTLGTVIVENPVPPTAGTDIFGFVESANLDIRVPDSAVSTYKATSGWSTFKNDINSIAGL